MRMMASGPGRRAFIASGLAASAFAALPVPVRSAAQAAANDVALLREILTALHAGLYRYASPSDIDAALDRLERQWAAAPDLAARYLDLSRFLAMIRCGHSYANFFNQKKAVADDLFGRSTRLPFAFKWVGRQMVVLADQSGMGKLPRGTVVKAINNVSASDMLARLLPYARADGSNDAKRVALMAVTGKENIETFDVFYGLVYGAPPSGQHRLRVRIPGAAADSTVELPALTLEQRRSFVRKVDYRGDQPVWDWTMRDDGIAVLTMDGWALYNSKWKWQDWLNDRLDSLKGARGLIVDIRENEGGNDCGDIILSRFAGRDIVKPLADRLVRYRKVPDGLNRYLDTWDDSFRDWGADAESFDETYFRLKQGVDGNILVARGPRVDVPLAVLTSPQNSSATFQFAALCRQSGVGTLVGETTGGNRRGINGGAYFFARLPDSGLEFDVPLIGYFPKTKMPDAGIVADIRLALSAKDIANGYDRQMQAAVAHLLRR
ncbi:MAG TPA: S41 family peptidase [Sphingorhabdus sp.]|nr:S41 family peptidase [Sphingorhabdus sp.]